MKKLKSKFTIEDYNMYIMNFYVYLKYDPIYDFPVNLEEVLDFIGFSRKDNFKRILDNNFIENEDYIILSKEKQVNDRNLGCIGLNKEKIMLNVDCFKQVCMKVDTDKSKKIRKYYLKLEKIYNELLLEEIETMRDNQIM